MRGYNFNTLKENYGGELDKSTFKHERVRSLEELVIANFLFMNNIDYEYERNFQLDYTPELDNYLFNNLKNVIPRYIRMEFLIDLSTNLDIIDVKKCKSDFYLPKYNLYLEHFGVDEHGNANWLNKEESMKYKEDMEFKIDYFKKHNIQFISTYSYYKSKGILLEKLEELLINEGVKLNKRSFNDIYQLLIKNKKYDLQFKEFKKLIKLFIDLFESQKLSIDSFEKFKKSNNRELDAYTKKKKEMNYS